MRANWTVGTVIAAMLALASACGPADAATDEPLLVSGSLTFTWHGDPAHGCAAVGDCGVQGSLIVHGGPGTDLSPGGGILPLNGPATVRVSNGPASGSECLDTLPNGIYLNFNRGGDGRLFASVGSGAASSSRCAGPLAQDLSRLRWPIRKTGAKRPSFDLRTTQGFAAGPLRGTLSSTLRLRPDTANRESFSSGSSQSAPSRPLKRKLVERVELRWHASGLAGALQTTFTSVPGPTCDQLAACGTRGSIDLSLPGWHDTLVLDAQRVVHRRASARQALTDLAAGRLSVSAYLLGPAATVRTLVQETLDGPGQVCRDTVPARTFLNFSPGPRGGGRALSASLAPDFASDPLRTHCPGPSSTTNTGSIPFLAEGALPLARVLDPTSTLYIAGAALPTPGYSATRSGHLGFLLRRFRVTAGTDLERAP